MTSHLMLYWAITSTIPLAISSILIHTLSASTYNITKFINKLFWMSTYVLTLAWLPKAFEFKSHLDKVIFFFVFNLIQFKALVFNVWDSNFYSKADTDTPSWLVRKDWRIRKLPPLEQEWDGIDPRHHASFSFQVLGMPWQHLPLVYWQQVFCVLHKSQEDQNNYIRPSTTKLKEAEIENTFLFTISISMWFPFKNPVNWNSQKLHILGNSIPFKFNIKSSGPKK
jgi:hypothetical protein